MPAKLYAVSRESKSNQQIARDRIDSYQEKKSALPEPWRIEIHDRQSPAKPLDVDGILRESLGDLIGLK